FFQAEDGIRDRNVIGVQTCALPICKDSEVVEGDFDGYCIIIEFPDMEQARGWYYSDAYQNIADLRINNCEGSVILVKGVPGNYRSEERRVGKEWGYRCAGYDERRE